MLVTLFRSRFAGDPGEEYNAWMQELLALVQQNPGFVDTKSFRADDGERLTVVRFRDQESLRNWSLNARHKEAKRLAKEKWYEYFEIEIAEVIRSSSFSRQESHPEEPAASISH